MNPLNKTNAGLLLGLRPANERRRYFVTSSLIGWVQAWNQPWNVHISWDIQWKDHIDGLVLDCYISSV